MKALTQEQWAPYHHEVLSRLTAIGQSVDGVRTHQAGIQYTSLMSCFLMHNVSGARSLLALWVSSGVEWFPVTSGYMIARSMFEVDVNAHYITKSPEERSRQYILFEYVLQKRSMDACSKHRFSKNQSWCDAMELEWKAKWEKRENEVNAKFAEVEQLFKTNGKSGKLFKNWSGKSIWQLAEDVNHVEAYETFYSELSSFIHADVNMANRFLRQQPDGPFWTQRANWYDVGEVLHDASSFLSCFLKLFGAQFGVWNDKDIDACWDVEPSQSKLA